LKDLVVPAALATGVIATPAVYFIARRENRIGPPASP
jgi:hypothetical protein